MNKKIAKSFGIVVILLIFLLSIRHTPDTEELKQVKINGAIVQVELATTALAHEQGLSGRAALKEDQGMLFVFNQLGKYSFWMKDMNFAIDMIWLDEDMKVVYIKKNATPESYPDSFGPNENSKYVLEVVSGFADKNDVKVGDTAQVTF